MPPYFKTIASLLKNFGPGDFLDIACVTGLFFVLFHLLNNSRSLAALRTLLAILLTSFTIYFLAQVFDMAALALIFSRFWTVALVIYLIAFQADLRRAILEAGRRGGLIRALLGRSGSGVERLARAVARLSEKQLGALLVIERRDEVDPHLIDMGSEIDALISEDLIVTLFFSYNPLHDGAVIISGERIRRAATKLPLTKNADIPKGLGTRHHAGIEITEHCDAVSIIVSEETGVISVVAGGQIERGLDEEGLRHRLEDLLDARPAEEVGSEEDNG
jgi:diadenylate cyclase